MHIPFSTLPNSSKVWVYQSNKSFSSEEKAILSTGLEAFTNRWMVHGEPLRASFKICYDQFVVLAAEDVASGCSIDTSVNVLKDLGQTLGIDFFDRTQVVFLINGENITVPVSQLKKAFEEGIWTADSMVFNNAVSSLNEFNKGWLTSAGNTWLKRYLPKPSIAQ
jgi:hypothetical protein